MTHPSFSFIARRLGVVALVTLGVMAICPGGRPAAAQVVEKVAEPFEGTAWVARQWNKAPGTPGLVAEVPAPLRDASQRSMLQEVEFDGKGHQFYSAAPANPLVIPGEARRIAVWARSQSRGGVYGWTMKFRDGWGRTKVDGKDLQWELGKSGLGEAWSRLTFEVPDDWVRPISIFEVGTSNWTSRDKPGTARLWLDHLEATTDISAVDPQSGALRTWKPGPAGEDGKPAEQPIAPLLAVTLATPDPHNVFAGEPPALLVDAQSWKPGTLEGELVWRVRDAEGRPVEEGREALEIVDVASVRTALPLEKFGLYHVDAQLSWADGTRTQASMPIAYVPAPVELTDQEKEDSPYGLNVHGGRDRMIQTFRDAGIVWFRDYAFNFDWMVKAKGADKRYSGWPWYPQIMKEYDDAGAMLLSCHAAAIKRPPAGITADDEAIGPDLGWTRELIDMVMAFPQIRYHELDNEYDLPYHGNDKFEEPIGWANYDAYHAKFGEVLRTLGDGHFIAVENGRAGIWPDRIHSGMASGGLTPMQVINSHHYTGVEAPEVNVKNNNTGFSDRAIPRLFFDQLRDAKREAIADGVERQHWLTEFGWDTEAGKVVTPRQQAAYLQRAYMMFLAAGTEKGFWYFDKDLAEQPTTFFGGCGLMDFRLKPKLSYAAFAGMTRLLPAPEFVGIINTGENTWGYVFRNRGELVAAMWTLDDSTGPRVTFDGASLFDAFANPIEGASADLGMMPIYAVGIDPASAWYQQTAYMLHSPYLEATCSGDDVTVELRVGNNREQAIAGKASLTLPSGWTDASGAVAFEVPAGQTQLVPLTFRISPDAEPGEQRVWIDLRESDATVKQVPLRVRVEPALAMTVASLPAEAGSSTVKVSLSNRSRSRAIAGELVVALPGSWSAPKPRVEVAPLAPGESRDIELPIDWTGTWEQGESAQVSFEGGRVGRVTSPIIAGQMPVHRAPTIEVDGKLDDWSEKHRVPGWLLGVRGGHAADTDIYLAWAEDGLYVALEVRDSQVRVDSPDQFWWNIDVLELWVDAANTKKNGSFEKGHHQFFFVPQPKENRVYAGQWKRGEELAETRQDIPGVPTASRRTDTGYVMEFKLPASLLEKFDPKPDAKIGFNLNLNATGKLGEREVFWPTSKQVAGSSVAANWGTIRLMP